MDLLKILSNFLDKENKLVSIPSKKKMKIFALLYFASKFELGKKYTEKEVNAIINEFCAFKDPATIRRDLFNYKFLNRENNGQSYWLEQVQPTLSELGIEE